MFDKAMRKQEEILDMDLPDTDNEHFGRVLGAQQAIATSIVSTGFKLDENRFRKQKKEAIKSLFDRFNNTPGSTIEGQAIRLPTQE